MMVTLVTMMMHDGPGVGGGPDASQSDTHYRRRVKVTAETNTILLSFPFAKFSWTFLLAEIRRPELNHNCYLSV